MNTPSVPNQLGSFLNNQSENSAPLELDEPTVVFPSALELTLEQEKALVETAMRRYGELSNELGINDVKLMEHGSGRSNINDRIDSFLGRRHLYELVYRMEMEWREQTIGNLFEDHNIHIPMVRRIVQQQISRAQNYFFATDPWFALDAQGKQDKVAAEKLDLFSKFKAKQTNVKQVLSKAIELAFIRGETVVKSSYGVDLDIHETFAIVAIDPSTNEPLVANDQDYIYEDDKWIVYQDQDGNIIPEQFVLKRDPSTGLEPGETPDSLSYERRKVRRMITHFKGGELENLYYTDILVPRDASDIQKADCVCHVFETQAIELAQAYMNRGLDPGQNPKFIELLNNASGDSGAPTTGRFSQRDEEGDSNDGSFGVTGEPAMRIGEFYMHMDVNNDGRQESIMLVLDLESEKPIFYDHVANVTPDGKRPLHVIRVNPVDGRWHGTSQVKLFYDLQMFTDTLTARWDFSQSRSGRVDIVNPEALVDGDVDDDIEINGGETFQLKPNKQPEDFFKPIYLSDIKANELQRQIEFVQQIMINLGGTGNANDSQMAGLETTKLATGVRNIEKSGQELFAPLLDHLDPGLSDAMKGFLLQTIFNMDEQEVFEFFEGGVRSIAEIAPDEAKDLDFVVTMELTRYKGEQELIQGMESIGLIERFYSLPPEIQQISAPQYIDIAKLYGMRNADEVFIPIGGMLPPQGGGMSVDSPEQARMLTGSSQPPQSPENL